MMFDTRKHIASVNGVNFFESRACDYITDWDKDLIMIAEMDSIDAEAHPEITFIGCWDEFDWSEKEFAASTRKVTTTIVAQYKDDDTIPYTHVFKIQREHYDGWINRCCKINLEFDWGNGYDSKEDPEYAKHLEEVMESGYVPYAWYGKKNKHYPYTTCFR